MANDAPEPRTSMMPPGFEHSGAGFDEYAAMNQFLQGNANDTMNAGLIDPHLNAFMGAPEPPTGAATAESAVFPAGAGVASTRDFANFLVSPSPAGHPPQLPPRSHSAQGSLTAAGVRNFTSSAPPPQTRSPAHLDPGTVLPAPPYPIQQPLPSTGPSALLHSTFANPNVSQPATTNGIANNLSALEPQRQGLHRYHSSGQLHYPPQAYGPEQADPYGQPSNTSNRTSSGAMTGFPPTSTRRSNYPVFPPYSGPMVNPSGGAIYPPPSYAHKQVPPYGNPSLGPSLLGYVPVPVPAAGGSKRQKLPNGYSGNHAVSQKTGRTKRARSTLKSPSTFLDLDNQAIASFVPPVDASARASNREPSFAAADAMENSRVMSARAAKKHNSMQKADPSTVYKQPDKLPRSEPFGPKSPDGRLLFTYTEEGQLAEDRVYTKEELQLYLDARRCVLWIQQAPSQCSARLQIDDRRCRWDDCPVASRVIGSGWFRVVFDEYPQLTTKGVKDPFKVAGMMHLWCFEQCFDIVDLFLVNRLRPDTRILPREISNAMSINRDSDRDIVKMALDPWLKRRADHRQKHGPETLPREHDASLSYRLSKYHVDNQTGARQKARDVRNVGRVWKERTTIDVHMGDLQVFVNHCNYKKKAKRRRNRPGRYADSEDEREERAESRSSGGHSEMAETIRYAPRRESQISQRKARPEPYTTQPEKNVNGAQTAVKGPGSRNNSFDADAFSEFFQLQPWQNYSFDEPNGNALLAFTEEQQTSPAAVRMPGVQMPAGGMRARTAGAGANASTAQPVVRAVTGATNANGKRGRTGDTGGDEERGAKPRSKRRRDGARE
ncbi:hypothetical protein GQ602_007063 [Ophiocordyceps camponoti-floridani]|uniref:Uncharacterized protein n=1 Tax=Ophiocordyceps camponoti-floridani TaxID=2030778 RepID=A0A8H4Q0P2_9HYPO|nr:hypothetical protein GQ602_007063 [Ophiocordyceps camponoti-floridani]